MAHLTDLPLKFRLFLMAYRYRRLDPVPWTRLTKPLSECRVALVTTAAYYLPDQEPFDERRPGGDTTFRVLRTRTAQGRVSPLLKSLIVGHRSRAFDAAGITADYNLALPVEALLELERRSAVGHLHEEALSFMGSITAPRRLIKYTAPEAARRLAEAGVDAVFLTPV